ncbi:MAG: dienelactone hydrolase family protein, partial [Gammaproteobacteria bacterium]|nr:dienelactone hydrolase family protein [Gammaproteobacteria bacterium]
MGEMVNFNTPGDMSVSGYLARAGDDTAPGGIVLQEWWGLNDQIKATADRFAAAGFTALAPDLFAGRVTEDADEAGHMMNGLDWVGATNQDICGAANYLKQSMDQVGVVGFCMGGALTVIASAKLAQIDTAVCFYGIPPRDHADPAGISLPFQAHFANQDDWCTPTEVDEF